jgi:hypothetical protein
MKNNEILNSEDTKDYSTRVLKKKCECLVELKEPFTMIKSGSSYELASRIWNEKASTRAFTSSDLSFINSVRNHIDKYAKSIDFIDTYYAGEEINYIRVNEYKVGERIEDLIYVDINGAYWQTAHNLGIISDKLYLRGLDVGKIVRLAALGSLAKKKDIWKFDGNDFKKMETIKNPNENLWFAICKRVSDVMGQVVSAIGDDFVFYWVDGIYVKNTPEVLQTVLGKFIEQGYTSKFEKIPYIEFHEKGFDVQGALKTDLKHFSWVSGSSGSKKKNNAPITEYLENERIIRVMESVLYKKPANKVPAKKKKG